jgi:hypothetical protein
MVKETETKPVAKKDSTDLYEEGIQATKEKLEKGEHTQFMIQLAPGEQPGAIEVVTINGYKTEVPKGQLVNIPVAVAQMIANKYNIEMNAGKQMRTDRASDVGEALN